MRFNSSRAPLACAFTSILLLPSVSQGSNDAFAGQWQAAILGKSGTNKYNLQIDISESNGKLTGTTRYLDLGCGGTLTAVQSSSEQVTFRETLTRGKSKCVQGAGIRLVRKQGGLTYEWLYPNGKTGLQATLVPGNGGAGSAASYVAAPAASSKSTTTATAASGNSAASGASANATISDAELAFTAIDDMAAHPEDPQNPLGLVGATDEEVSSLPLEEAAELIQFALPHAEANLQEPRYLFALGRLALLQGDEEFAEELLTKAANAGSAAAEAYLAHITNDLQQATTHLRNAIKGGFTPARAWLAKVGNAAKANAMAQSVPTPGYGSGYNTNYQYQQQQYQTPPVKFDPSVYNRPDLINAFYEGDVSGLGNDYLANLTYVSAMHNFFNETTSLLFLVNDKNIITEIDPSLSHQIARKITTTDKGMNEAIGVGMESFFGPLIAIGQTRKRGGSLKEEMHAINQAIMDSPHVRLELVREKALQDAKRLALTYDQDPQVFRRVYSGMKKFVRES
ncbi:hypothetical protein [Marinobacter maritimus]|uniref:hypothetical protein n=1 Tax=Marinobacter maritimus TaxID=277961 RepID=UPI0011A2B6B9|nr:hypothetical protein [Marinobacter maritimus]